MSRLRAESLTLSYKGGEPIVEGLNLAVANNAITAIVGPNACGKSTLLRAMARLLHPRAGEVVLDGEAIHRRHTRDVAHRLGLLPQQPETPDSITVEDLVRRGRYPHQRLLQTLSKRDERAVRRALALAGMSELRDRPVDELSGGQRQRAWIAMALAQETPILLLDEPTTFLDIPHRNEVLALLRRLSREEGCTIVAVLHDLNDVFEVSDRVVAMRDGTVIGEGATDTTLTPQLVRSVFGVDCDLCRDGRGRFSRIVPRSRALPALRGKTIGVSGGNASSDSHTAASRDEPLRTGAPVVPALRTESLTAGYERRVALREITVSIPTGRITAILGPNACGKSTLLRTLARLIIPTTGRLFLNDLPLYTGSHRRFAQQLAMLAQGTETPDGLCVEDLVAAGRYPHQRWFRQWGSEDCAAIDRAMAAAGVAELRDRPVRALSGGQRQRAWIAMVLAQDTELLLLDEPTTFLDIAHQVEVLDLIWTLNRERRRTCVLVLHDLWQASRYADNIVLMNAGRIVATGSPAAVLTEERIRRVFGVESLRLDDPQCGGAIVLPRYRESGSVLNVRNS